MTAATRKPADDQPFDFNLDAVVAEVELTPFRVHFGGRRWEFAHMESLDIWQLTAAAGQGDNAALIGVFKTALGDEQFKEFRKIPLPQKAASDLFDAYAKFCGVDPGELPGSTD
uniref:Phage tail assembly protein n=1 Tax=Thermocrispum agreste TaxID=37925 RepID=A0A2W4JNC2_9PSEU|nr:MAG: hypothetical protein DIU77_03435 [Thermocrispum agreste]